jgi:hypothetical protein
MHFDFPVVADEAELAKLVHEEADARAGGSDHLRQRFLADVRADRFWLPSLPKLASKSSLFSVIDLLQ